MNNKGGRCKWFDVAGFRVQGTWEYRTALALEQQKIKWEKITTGHTFKYILNEKVRHYTPDFFLEDLNLYLELKGYWWNDDKDKMIAVISQYPSNDFCIMRYNDLIDLEQEVFSFRPIKDVKLIV
jgi:hypothetical protein